MNTYPVSITTAADGSATAYTDAALIGLRDDGIDGEVTDVQYVKTDFADGVSMAITGESSGTAILSIAAGSMNASDSWRPVVTCDTSAGAEIADVYKHPRLRNERAKIVIADGGNVKTGTVYITVK